jgi:hypothetical protein
LDKLKEYGSLAGESELYGETELGILLELHDCTYAHFPTGFDYFGIREALKSILSGTDSRCQLQSGMDAPTWRARRLINAQQRVSGEEAAARQADTEPAIWMSLEPATEQQVLFKFFDDWQIVTQGGPRIPFGHWSLHRFQFELIEASSTYEPFEIHFKFAQEIISVLRHYVGALRFYEAQFPKRPHLYHAEWAEAALSRLQGTIEVARAYARLPPNKKLSWRRCEGVARRLPFRKDIGKTALKSFANTTETDVPETFLELYGMQFHNPSSGKLEYLVEYRLDRSAAICQMAQIWDREEVAECLATLAIHGFSPGKSGLVNERLAGICLRSLSQFQRKNRKSALERIAASSNYPKVQKRVLAALMA